MVDHRAVLVNKKNLDEEVRNGGGGIRTPASREAPDGFQDRSLQPGLGTPPGSRSRISETGGQM